MGIRFRCHHCEHELNLKEFQAGRRARCPACSGRFRVPTASAEFSVPLDDQEAQLATVDVASHQANSAGEAFNLRPSMNDPDVGANRTSPLGLARTGTNQGGMPTVIAEAPQAVWYVRPPSGGQYGPAEGHLFHDWLKDNRVSADSLVWRDGWPEWQMAGDVFLEIFGDNWRVSHEVENAVALVNDDAMDGPIVESRSAAPIVAPVAASRRKKKQATYGIVIGILAFLALVLIGVLLSVVL